MGKLRVLFYSTVLLFTSLIVKSQTIDTVIVTSCYKSFYSYQTKTPLFVCYGLRYKSKRFSREGMIFKSEQKENFASLEDYAKSGYDIGHMCPAEDMSYDSLLEERTFRFYNALPQTPNLNRGTWKRVEGLVRQMSSKDSLVIICGGFQFSHKIKTVSVPDSCFKIVKMTDTNVIKCWVFSNDKVSYFREVKLEYLLGILPKNYLIYIQKIL